MTTAASNGDASGLRAVRSDVPVVSVASAVALAAAGSLLGYSLFAKKRRLPASGKVLLGVVAGFAGLGMWVKRQEEMDAARRVMGHVHEVRDARWLKKHPVAYG
jgi:hypothetical protein